MNLGLEWINTFVNWLVTWLPSVDVIECSQAGVKVRSSFFRRGVKITSLGPGLYWYYPRTTKVYACAVVRRPYDLPVQSVDTLDGTAMMISVSLVGQVSDPVKWLTKTDEPEAVVREIGAAAATDCVATRKIGTLRKDFSDGTIEEELLANTKKALRPYGMKVLDARLTDHSHHTAHRCEGSATVNPIGTNEDEE